MKKITVNVDEEVLAAARRMVREYLSSLAQHEHRTHQSRTRLRQLSRKPQGRVGQRTWSREDLRDR